MGNTGRDDGFGRRWGVVGGCRCFTVYGVFHQARGGRPIVLSSHAHLPTVHPGSQDILWSATRIGCIQTLTFLGNRLAESKSASNSPSSLNISSSAKATTSAATAISPRRLGRAGFDIFLAGSKPMERLQENGRRATSENRRARLFASRSPFRTVERAGPVAGHPGRSGTPSYGNDRIVIPSALHFFRRLPAATGRLSLRHRRHPR